MAPDLRARLHAAAPHPVTLFDDQALRAAVRGRRRRRRTAAGLVLLALLPFAMSGWGDPPPDVVLTPDDAAHPAASPAVDLEGASWQPLAEAPVDPRANALATWTGSEVLFWGGFADPPTGDNLLSDGARLDPATGAWTQMSPAPITPSFKQSAVWTGREMLVYGWQGVGSGFTQTQTQAGLAAYSPASDAWRVVDDDPLGFTEVRLVTWTGSEMLVLATESDHRDGPTGRVVGAAWDPATGDWRRVAPSPLGVDHGGVNAAWVDGRAIVWGGSRAYGLVCTASCAEPVYKSDSTAYDPATDRWTTLPPAPEEIRAPGRAVWTGDALLVVVDQTVHRYEPDQGTARAITHLPDTPSHVLATDAGLIWVTTDTSDPRQPVVEGGAVGSDGARLAFPSVGTGTLGSQAVAWTGTSLVVWGGGTAPDVVRDEPAARTRGAVLLAPGDAIPPVVADRADFTIEAVGGVAERGVQIVVTDAGPLAHGGETDHDLVITAGRDVTIAGGAFSSRLRAEEGAGALALIPHGCAAALRALQRGLEATCEVLPLPRHALRAGESTRLPVRLLAQPEPFAPTPGRYRATLTIEVDGAPVAVEVSYALEGRTELGRRSLPSQREDRALLARTASCAQHNLRVASRVTGPGDLTVEVDALGWWGRHSYGARSAAFSAQQGLMTRVGEESFLAIDGLRLRECASTPTNAALQEESLNRVQALWQYDGLEVRVTQEASPPDGDGSARLVQTYVITNTDPAARQVRLARLLDAGASHDGEPEDPAASRDGARLSERAVSGPVVVTASGDLDGRTTPDRWTIGPQGLADLLASTGQIPAELDGRIIGPDESPGTIPFSAAVLVQQWDATLPPQQPVTLTLTTTFARG